MLVSACLYALLASDRCSLEFRNSVQKSWLLPCKVPPSICEIFETVLAFERGYGDRRSLPSRSYVVLRVGHSVSYFYGATSCSLRLQLCKPALGLFLGCLIADLCSDPYFLLYHSTLSFFDTCRTPLCAFLSIASHVRLTPG